MVGVGVREVVLSWCGVVPPPPGGGAVLAPLVPPLCHSDGPAISDDVIGTAHYVQLHRMKEDDTLDIQDVINITDVIGRSTTRECPTTSPPTRARDHFLPSEVTSSYSLRAHNQPLTRLCDHSPI